MCMFFQEKIEFAYDFASIIQMVSLNKTLFFCT